MELIRRVDQKKSIPNVWIENRGIVIEMIYIVRINGCITIIFCIRRSTIRCATLAQLEINQTPTFTLSVQIYLAAFKPAQICALHASCRCPFHILQESILNFAKITTQITLKSPPPPPKSHPESPPYSPPPPPKSPPKSPP
jgi:hypothetical protein